MAIELIPLNELDPDIVQAALAETIQRVSEDNPQIDLRRGVFAELLAYYHATLDTQRRMNINQYLAGRSLLAIAADPSLADTSLVEDVLSNFRMVRKPGRIATGDVTVVVSTDTSVIVGEGTIWEARGRRYRTPTVFTAKAEEGQITSANDRLLARLSDGNYAFTITVEAEDIGTDFDVKKDTLVSPLTVPPNYVSSYAAADFAPGLAAETNEELLTRLQEGIAAKTLSNRVNMSAMLRDIDAFSRIVAVSIIGCGDAELVRAQHSVMPIVLPGRCDWYIRTQEKTTAINLTKTATLLQINTDLTGLWQVGIGRDEAPGVYEFLDVKPLDSDPSVGGYDIDEDVRGLDMTGTGFRPDVLTATEAAYTAFSTAVLRFTDTTDHSLLSVGETREYQITAVCLPLIAEIQEHVSSRDVRPHGSECLVKAPIPCFLTLNFTINKRTGQADPDLPGIRAALCALVNTLGFTGAVYASQVQDVIHGYLTNGQTVSAIDMHARIRYPDGTTAYVRSDECAQIPDDPDNMVSPKTAQFFADDTTIGITVVTKLPTAL